MPVRRLVACNAFTHTRDQHTAPADCSRCQRLRTVSSERPGSCAAILRHLQPKMVTPERMSSSSAAVHSLRSGPLRLPAALGVATRRAFALEPSYLACQ